MTREEILSELKNISDKADELCKLIIGLNTSKLGFGEFENFIAKADDLCEHVLDLSIDIVGNWRKVSDGVLPDKSDGEQIYFCQIANNKGILKDPLLCRYYCGEFVNHITLAPMAYDDNVTAWMEIPIYEKK